MNVDVQSEVGRLESVLLHRPGDEIVRMTQHDLDRMLFDDILSAAEAAREHEVMANIIAATGAEVLELEDLLSASLEAADTASVETLVGRCCESAGCPSAAAILSEWPARKLAKSLIEGVYWRELEAQQSSLAHVTALLREPDPMALRPLPNLMFLRDPCITVFDRVVQGLSLIHI